MSAPILEVPEETMPHIGQPDLGEKDIDVITSSMFIKMICMSGEGMKLVDHMIPSESLISGSVERLALTRSAQTDLSEFWRLD